MGRLDKERLKVQDKKMSLVRNGGDERNRKGVSVLQRRTMEGAAKGGERLGGRWAGGQMEELTYWGEHRSAEQMSALKSEGSWGCCEGLGTSQAWAMFGAVVLCEIRGPPMRLLVTPGLWPVW